MGFGVAQTLARQGASVIINELGMTTSVGRAGSPQDVGAAVAYLLSLAAEWINGQVLPVNSGSLVS